MTLATASGVRDGTQVPARRIEWEPDKGRFDLAVRLAERRRMFIELKVDGELHEGQIEGQLAHAEQAPDQPVVYLLLGITGITRGPRWPSWTRIVGARHRPRIFEAADVRAALQAVQGEDLRADVLELVRAYEKMLADLERRTQSYENKSVADFDYFDYLGYFDALRQAAELKGGEGAQVHHVPNPAGGFVCCAWGGTKTPVAGIYLQFEGSRLCLKIWVEDAPDSRRSARQRAVHAALAQVDRFPSLGVQQTRGRLGERMTVAELTKVDLVSNPRDPGLLAKLREAEAFLRATAETLDEATPAAQIARPAPARASSRSSAPSDRLDLKGDGIAPARGPDRAPTRSAIGASAGSSSARRIPRARTSMWTKERRRQAR